MGYSTLLYFTFKLKSRPAIFTDFPTSDYHMNYYCL